MHTWFTYVWERLRSSLWFLPGAMSLAAVSLAVLCARLDESAGAWQDIWLLYRGDPQSARTLLSTVAGSMMTVAGVSFSITMVALSLTSSQFGPRLLVNFMRDRGNQVVLGAFVGTFLFCLIALGTTNSSGQEVVSVSATAALLLAAFSLLLLVYFIHHVATSMQADYLIKVVAHELRDSLERAFPEDAGFPGADGAWPGPDQPAAAAPATGYLQGVDQPGLIRLASEHDAVLTVLRRPGHFVIEGQRLVAVEGVSLSADLEKRIGRAFIIGGNRTADRDPEFGILQLVEIAVRALSPGINDPFTAMSCVDHLSGSLCRIARHAPRPALHCDDDGAARLRIDRTDFVGLLDAAFNQIRQFATGTPSVSIRLLDALASIAAVCERAERREAIGRHARLVLESCQGTLVSGDARTMQNRYHKVEQALAASAGYLASPSTAT